MEDSSAVLTSKATYTERGVGLIRWSGLRASGRRFLHETLYPARQISCQSLFAGIFSFIRQAIFGDIILCLVSFAFGCWHRHMSRPFTLWGRTYEVCLDCGKELPYSLEHMACIKDVRYKTLPTLAKPDSSRQTFGA